VGRLAGKCSICEHPKRSEIDRALVTRSASMRNIAEQFGVSTTALARHKKGHIPRLVEAAHAAAGAHAATSGRELIDELEALRGRVRAILDRAEEGGELRVALQAVRELRETIKAQAELGVAAELERRVDELEAMLEAGPQGRGGVRSG
jgi:hypothetical protein